VFVNRTDVMFHLKKLVNGGQTFAGKHNRRQVSNVNLVASVVSTVKYMSHCVMSLRRRQMTDHIVESWPQLLIMVFYHYIQLLIM